MILDRLQSALGSKFLRSQSSLDFFYPHLRTYLLIVEKGTRRERGRGREREKHIDARESSPSPQPMFVPGDKMTELNSQPLTYGTTLQPAEPHQPGLCVDFHLPGWGGCPFP